MGSTVGANPRFESAALYPGVVDLVAVDRASGEEIGFCLSLPLVSGVQAVARIRARGLG
ncbi:MAG: hypothetical protein P1V35_11620 [Planctomycetota bacterium]|nr:hypothetical protein [Planctomycetota bacterium]